MSSCVHTCVRRVCVPTAGRGAVPLSLEVLQRDWGRVVPGGCQAWVCQPKRRLLRSSVGSFSWAEVSLSRRAALVPVLDPDCRVSGPTIPGEARLGRGSIFLKCLCAASEIPSASQANRSICAFRSLKIHGILAALGAAGAVHPAARTGTRVPTKPHPSEEAEECWVPRGVRGRCPSGVVARAWPGVVGMARPGSVSRAGGWCWPWAGVCRGCGRAAEAGP